jgi:hypothetical protein
LLRENGSDRSEEKENEEVVGPARTRVMEKRVQLKIKGEDKQE